MSRDMAYLLDILLHAKDTRDFTTRIDRDTFFSDHKCQVAVIRGSFLSVVVLHQRKGTVSRILRRVKPVRSLDLET